MPTREDAKAAAVAKPESPDAPESKVDAPASDAAPKPEKPKREPKPKAEPTDCACGVPDHGKTGETTTGDATKFPGCRGGKSTRKFAPGHDAKLVGWNTRRFAAKAITAEQAIDDVRTKSGNSALLVGKIKAATKRVEDERAAAERREQAAKDEKAKADEAPATPESAVNEEAAVAAGV